MVQASATTPERPGALRAEGLVKRFGAQRALSVLEERWGGLDRGGRRGVKWVHARLTRGGRALSFPSHVFSDVEEICSTMAVVVRGAVRSRGAAAALRRRYGEDSLERAF